jgi:hypothetical protein
VRLSLLGTSATNWFIAPPRMMDDDECGAVGGMRIGRGNRNTRRKPAPVPLCPQIPHDSTWARTRAAAVGSRLLTAWVMARPIFLPNAVQLSQQLINPRGNKWGLDVTYVTGRQASMHVSDWQQGAQKWFCRVKSSKSKMCEVPYGLKIPY